MTFFNSGLVCATFCGCFSWCFAEVTKPVQFTESHFACDPNKLLNAELGTRAEKGLQFTHVEPWREERVPSLSAVGCQLSVQLLWTCSAKGSCGLAERAKTTQFKAAGVPVITLSLFSVCAWETLSSRELWRLVSFPHFVSSAEPVCLKLSCRLDHNQATLKIQVFQSYVLITVQQIADLMLTRQPPGRQKLRPTFSPMQCFFSSRELINVILT